MNRFISILGIVLALSFQGFGQLYTFTNFGHEQGLEMSSIQGVTQTDDGLIWIGTDGAEIYKFDGDQFIPFTGNKNYLFHHATNLILDNGKVNFASKYIGYFEIDPIKETIQKRKTSTFLKGEPLFYSSNGKNTLYISKCDLYIENKSGGSNKKSFIGCDLVITQVIPIGENYVLLTNKGNFITNGIQFLELNKWITPTTINGKYDFGYFHDSKLTLFDQSGTKWLEVVLDENNGFYSVREFERSQTLYDGDAFLHFNFNSVSGKGAATSRSGMVYSLEHNSQVGLKYIIPNFDDNIQKPTCTFVDRNGSIWIGTAGFGLYRLSLEPFTKIKILPDYGRSDIASALRCVNGDVLVSYFDNETTIISARGAFQKKSYPITINGYIQIGNVYWLASNHGLKKLKESAQGKIEDIAFTNERVTFVFHEWNKLFVGIAGKGIYLAEINGNELSDFKQLEVKPGLFFYTAQSLNKATILFGTNDGLFSLKKGNAKLERLKLDYEKLGAYSGLSAKDKYGNSWFTVDRALIKVDGNLNCKVYSAAEYFKTNLLYTLQSDIYGNLFLGTNKGIFKIKVDKSGTIISTEQFNKNSGFSGHETNMRAQFSNEDGLFVGTIDGLYKITPDLLERHPLPSSPILIPIESDDASIKKFQLKINNPISRSIKYIYRLSGDGDWKKCDSLNRILLTDLSNGSYTLEVKASYDGINFSDSNKTYFTISKPIWKTSWFIIVIVGLIVGLNLILIRYNKAFDASRLLDTKDNGIHIKLTPGILLFGFLSITTAQFTAPFLDNDLVLHFGSTILTSVTLLCLFLFSLSARSNKTEKENYSRLLLIGLIVAQTHFLYELYVSHIHPFQLIGVILVSMIAPYVLKDLKQTVIYSILLLAISLVFAQIITDNVYNKGYFLVAIFMLCCLLIFVSYLRYNSLEKLLFISAIIDKGNLPAIAFDKKGVIHYASENISHFADIRHDQLIRRNISYLNNFVPFDDKYKESDLLKDFVDGQYYLVPMKNADKEVRWVEWSYKNFTDDLKVIIGQDVTDKMELENTYELLVQNAEDFIYRCDVDGNFTFLNNISFEKLGYTKEDLIGKSSLSIIDEQYREEIGFYYRDHFLNKRTSSYREFPIRTKEGALLWIGQYVTTLFAPGSDFFIKGFIALARDITDIRMQQELILEQRDNITSSIHYAKRIQQNLLPHERMFSNLFGDHLVIYKAKDIVSGDFYWMDDLGDKLIFALADCTGHGVPGSFMTLLGMNLLNMIILEDRIEDPGKILDRLDERLLEILPRGEHASQVNDGMEITVCSLNKSTGELIYACAGSRFLIYRNNEFTMFKGDNKHIGDIHHDGFTFYQSNYTNFELDDQLILFTDGFQDQFGGPNDKKYSFRRFLEMFEEVIDQPLSQQKIAIEKEFELWLGHGEQTDDMTVIALRR